MGAGAEADGQAGIFANLRFKINADVTELKSSVIFKTVRINENTVQKDLGEIPLATITSINNFPLPENYTLSQNYPNPFNPITHIQYGLPEQSDVTVIIYNVVGRKIKEFKLSNQKAGWHEIVWDGTNDRQQKVSTGIYIYQMRALRHFDKPV